MKVYQTPYGIYHLPVVSLERLEDGVGMAEMMGKSQYRRELAANSLCFADVLQRLISIKRIKTVIDPLCGTGLWGMICRRVLGDGVGHHFSDLSPDSVLAAQYNLPGLPVVVADTNTILREFQRDKEALILLDFNNFTIGKLQGNWMGDLLRAALDWGCPVIFTDVAIFAFRYGRPVYQATTIEDYFKIAMPAAGINPTTVKLHRGDGVVLTGVSGDIQVSWMGDETPSLQFFKEVKANSFGLIR